MITVSEGFKNAMRAPVKTVGASVEVVDGDDLPAFLLVAAREYFGQVFQDDLHGCVIPPR